MCDRAEQRGLNAIAGELIPNAKNLPVRDLFERHGFDKVSQDDAGASLWRIGVPQQRLQWPDWFRVVRGGARQPESADIGE